MGSVTASGKSPQSQGFLADEIRVSKGDPAPFGATVLRTGVNFALYSRNATSVTLELFASAVEKPVHEIRLDPAEHRTGDVWHVFVEGVGPGARYGYRVDRAPNENSAVHRYDPTRLVLDPFALAITGSPIWGTPYARRGLDQDIERFTPRGLVVDDEFDWEGDRPLGRSLGASVIYELHVRGFTRHQSSGVESPGTYEGLIEKIPYLVGLGVTTVELLPVFEFDDLEYRRVIRVPRDERMNFWGYSPLSFFSPKASYARESRDGASLTSFKRLVKALHAAGIEVILDVVFNHTAEGNATGPTLSFRGIDNSTYYIVDDESGEYVNCSGCGNTVNCNHPVVADLILDSLRYWVCEMHVDGFRFDLASILCRGTDGEPLERPPVIERIAADPVLADTKLVAEAWDAVGLYQVGSFPGQGRFAEWNGKFRDDVRRFVRGDVGMVSALASRMRGSPDLYEGDSGRPWHSINFVTCHDGFTLRDLVSYEEKRNDANGEESRDGESVNHGWNCGFEGPTADAGISALRLRQMKNLLSILLLSHGTPMILGGDEHGRTQRGNNNAYCQDNELSWIDWHSDAEGEDLERFVRTLIRWRELLPLLRPSEFVAESVSPTPGFTFHGVELGRPDWLHESRSLAIEVRGSPAEGAYWIAVSAHVETLDFALPAAPGGKSWSRVVDTSLESPLDLREPGEAEPYEKESYRVAERSVVMLVAR